MFVSGARPAGPTIHRLQGESGLMHNRYVNLLHLPQRAAAKLGLRKISDGKEPGT
jgi:hypothetical protein